MRFLVPVRNQHYIKQVHQERTHQFQLYINNKVFYHPLNHKEEIAYHTRSNSFPSRPHPVTQEVDEYLCRLRSSETTSTSSISQSLSGLQDLHDCVDRLLQLPLSQQSLAQEKHQKWDDKLLDASLRILDICSTAKDAVSQTKECIQDHQSIIRRWRQDKSGVLTSEVRKYWACRKTVKKAIHNALGNLKANRSTFSSLNNDQE